MDRRRAQEAKAELNVGKTPFGDGTRPLYHRTVPERDIIADLRKMERDLDAPHDGSFTVDGDLDPTSASSLKPSWWGREPTNKELRAWVGEMLKRGGVHAPLSFRDLTFRYSASGKGYHLKGWAYIREEPGAPLEGLTAGNTFTLRRHLGDDPARLYYDHQRGDPQGWLADSNRYQDEEHAKAWGWRKAGAWVRPQTDAKDDIA